MVGSVKYKDVVLLNHSSNEHEYFTAFHLKCKQRCTSLLHRSFCKIKVFIYSN